MNEEEYDILKLLDEAIVSVKDEILEKEKILYGCYDEFYQVDIDNLY